MRCLASLTRGLLIAGCFTTALATPAVAADGCGCDTGDPRLALTVPSSVPLGGSDTIDLWVQGGNNMAWLMASTDCDSMQTVYGEICVKFPLLAALIVPIPATETASVPFSIPNDPAIDCLQINLQFLVCEFFKASSSMETLTIGNGICDGDFCTYTQGGWGTDCSGSNPGCLRDQNFDSVFPNGLVIGDQDGVDGDGDYALVLSSSAAVEAFLPNGSTGGTLDMDQTDPLTTSAGIFAGQLVAATLNLAFDDAGITGSTSTDLGDLEFVSCVDADLIGVSVRDLVDMANDVISGMYGTCVGGGSCATDDIVDVGGTGSANVSLRDIQDALDLLNNNFDNCMEDGNACLGLPAGS